MANRVTTEFALEGFEEWLDDDAAAASASSVNDDLSATSSVSSHYYSDSITSRLTASTHHSTSMATSSAASSSNGLDYHHHQQQQQQLIHPQNNDKNNLNTIEKEHENEHENEHEESKNNFWDWSSIWGHKLYDRETEQALLLERFHALVDMDSAPSSSSPSSPSSLPTIQQPQQQQPNAHPNAQADNDDNADADQAQIILITGPSGNGKTALVQHTLREEVITSYHGYFITGKFDQIYNNSSNSSVSSGNSHKSYNSHYRNNNNNNLSSFGAFAQAFTEYSYYFINEEDDLQSQEEEQNQEQEQEHSTTIQDRQEEQEQALPIPHSSTGPFVSRQQIQERVLRNVGTEGRDILTQMIPALTILLGRKETTTDHGVTHNETEMIGFEAQKRFQFVFKTFLATICSREHPIVLFLDDLQWANKESINLLAEILTDASIEGLVVVGACRGNEVTVDQDLAVMLRRLEDSCELAITEITVGPLRMEAVQQFLGDVFSLPPDPCRELAEVVRDYTGNNPFFILQFLRWITENNLLHIGTDDNDDGGPILTVNYSALSTLFVETGKDIIGLLCAKMRRMPVAMQETLQVAACFGANFSREILDRVLLEGCEEFLALAQSEGFITCLPQQHFPSQRQRQRKGSATKKDCTYAFVHDRVQQAIYSMIPSKSSFHLMIGRRLWISYTPVELLSNSILVANQLSHSISLIDDATEIISSAQLFLHAGKLAMKGSSFGAAATYFANGRGLLGRKLWQDHYSLALDLSNMGAQAEYASGNVQETMRLVDQILENGRLLDDKLHAFTTRMICLGTNHKIQEAVDLSLFVLRELGEPFPRNPGPINIVLELIKTSGMLRGKTNEDLMALKPMTDTRKLAAMTILNVVYSYLFVSRPLLSPLYSMRLVQLTLKHGVSSMSCLAFSNYCTLLAALGKIHESCRFADLGLAMVQRFDSNEWTCRTYFASYVFAYACRDGIRHSIDPLQFAYRMGLSTGDSEFAMFCAQFTTCCAAFASQPLKPLYNEMKLYRDEMIARNQRTTTIYLNCQIQFVANLLGESPNPAILTGQWMNADDVVKQAQAEGNNALELQVPLYSIIIAYLVHDFGQAKVMFDTLKKLGSKVGLLWTLRGQTFFQALVALSLAERCNDCFGRRMYLSFARKALKVFRKDVKDGVEVEAASMRVQFLEAEVEIIANGNLHQGIGKYETAAALAGNAFAFMEQGMAYERAASALRERGTWDQALPFLEKAETAYTKWGAVIKVREMRNLVRQGSVETSEDGLPPFVSTGSRS